MATAKLAKYRTMRDFSQTAEPSGEGEVAAAKALRFVIQKHDATRLHFDLRLEWDGVFRSWATPKGPSLDPRDRRLAVEVEDHPLDYGDFEGTIPKGQYGGGTVMLWDRGYWAPEKGFEDVGRALERGELKFVMEGRRMHGGWVLVRTEGRGGHGGKAKPSWLLIKHRDPAARDDGEGAPDAADRSVASRRTMADIAGGKGRSATPFMTAKGAAADAVWHSGAPGGVAEPARPKAKRAPARRAEPMPAFIEPQLTKAVTTPPSGQGWAHEVKFDGYRMQLRVEDGAATLKTRKGLDWSKRFPEIVEAGRGLPGGILDGEIVALDAGGAPDFAALQAALSDEKTDALVFFVFDQLFAAGEDLRPLPLSERKDRLRETLAEAPERVRYVDHFVSAGGAVLHSACRMHLEGIVSKRLDAPYRSGRSDAWTKAKCRAGHEVVIGGYTTTGGAFRSLIAGVYRDGELIHLGRVGTGFGREKAAGLLAKLKPLERKTTPFAARTLPRGLGEVHWVAPELVAEIEHEGFTGDGLLRQAAFKGLREDKPAKEVEAESPAPADTPLKAPEPRTVKPATVRPKGSAVVMGVTLSHADKTLWPANADEPPISKLELARYLEAIGDWMITHVRGRPCSIVRWPDGIGAQERFFQRHPGKGQSNLIEAVQVRGDRQPYMRFDRVEALVAAAQASALEFHPWNCQPFAPEDPGRLVFDLDPAPDVGFEQVVEAAREVRDRLEDVGLAPFCKTTGGKGLHVVTPLKAGGPDWAAAKAFARDLCAAMAADAPDRYLVNMSKKQRDGRIFLDYLRNDRMATAVAPLSPRGRLGAPVSMPLTWSQVRKGLDPAGYTVRTAPALVAKLTAWEDYCDSERPLAKAIERLSGRRAA